MRVDFYRLLGVRRDATNSEIAFAFLRYVRLFKTMNENSRYADFFLIYFSLLYDGVKMLLSKKGRVYYDTFQLIKYPNETIDIELYKKLNKKPLHNTKIFLISCKDEFLQNQDGAVRKIRRSDHFKQVMKNELIDFSKAMIKFFVYAVIIILINIIFSIN